MSTYFFVDYENVSAKGLSGIEKLSDQDHVIIFYSEKANTLTFTVHRRMAQSKAQIEYVNVLVGEKNSLDFQLVSYLGYLLARDEKAEYVIVSRDHGFASTVAFWEGRKFNILQANNLMRETQNGLKEKLVELLPDYPDDIPVIMNFLNKYKTKQGFNNALMKEFGTVKTSNIYKVVKPLLADKKGR